MSVLDSGVLVKVFWDQLVNPSNWVCGWDENDYSNSSTIDNSKYEMRTINCANLSVDSGLTIPIVKDRIRPWFHEK